MFKHSEILKVGKNMEIVGTFALAEVKIRYAWRTIPASQVRAQLMMIKTVLLTHK